MEGLSVFHPCRYLAVSGSFTEKHIFSALKCSAILLKKTSDYMHVCLSICLSSIHPSTILHFLLFVYLSLCSNSILFTVTLYLEQELSLWHSSRIPNCSYSLLCTCKFELPWFHPNISWNFVIYKFGDSSNNRDLCNVSQQGLGYLL
jgi:hypothetical protein